MTDLIALLPPGVGPGFAALLVLASVCASTLSAGTGLGGGSIMLAVLAFALPPPALIPIHGILQLGSNASRCFFLRHHLRSVTFGLFALGSVAGVVLGGFATLQVPQDFMRAGLGLFILWSVWGRMPAIVSRAGLLAGGFASGILTMFVGATGPFVAAYLRPVIQERMAFVAVHSACMTIQHTAKLVFFGLAGFAYAPYLPLTGVMIAGGFLGSWIGSRILDRLGDVWFGRIIRTMLTMAALGLLWDAFA